MEKIGLKLTNLKDNELIKLALENNSQAAFFALHSRYIVGLRLYISKYVQDQEDIEDICIISFQKAFKDLANFKTENKFSTWLYTIARNTAFDHQNKEIVRGKLDRTDILNSNSDSIDIADESINLEDQVIDNQDRELLINCIEGLPDLYRNVAKLCFIDNLGYKEISQKENIPINTVKTRISRAKSLLIKNIQEIEDEV